MIFAVHANEVLDLINEPTEKGPQIGDQISYKGKNVEVITGGGSNTV